MRTIIAGGREYTHNHYRIVEAAIAASRFSIYMVVSGACGIDIDDPRRDVKNAKGIDGLGERWADNNGIPHTRFYAAWKKLGRRAGPLRNEEMTYNADALIAIPGNGKGTFDMISRARKHGLHVYVHGPDEWFRSFKM